MRTQKIPCVTMSVTAQTRMDRAFAGKSYAITLIFDIHTYLYNKYFYKGVI